eukprot:s3271_g7.t1
MLRERQRDPAGAGQLVRQEPHAAVSAARRGLRCLHSERAAFVQTLCRRSAGEEDQEALQKPTWLADPQMLDGRQISTTSDESQRAGEAVRPPVFSPQRLQQRLEVHQFMSPQQPAAGHAWSLTLPASVSQCRLQVEAPKERLCAISSPPVPLAPSLHPWVEAPRCCGCRTVQPPRRGLRKP